MSTKQNNTKQNKQKTEKKAKNFKTNSQLNCIYSLVNGIPQSEHKDALQDLFLKVCYTFFAALHILRLNTNYNGIFNQLCGNKPDIKVLKDNRNRPYAFVQFETVDEAKTALKKVHGFILNRRPLRCERARVNRTIFISPKSNQSRKVCFFLLSSWFAIY